MRNWKDDLRKMPKKNSNSLFVAAGKLKTIRRAGWVKKVGIKDAESVADHTFRMAVIGMYLGQVLDLDSETIVRMCLLHDLAESKIGDLTPEEKKSEREHREMEDKIMNGILANIPKKARKRFSKDWKELLQAKSKESKLVWQIDRLEMGMQMKDYASSGIDRKLLAEFDPSKLLTGKLKKILEEYP